MFTIETINSELAKKVETTRTNDFVKVCSIDGSNKHCVVPQKLVDQYLNRIKEMEIYDDDIWIVTFPRCGTTWTQEMVWMLNNNLDYEGAQKELLRNRFPYIEAGGILNDMEYDSYDICTKLQRPRHIKTHLPLFLLPQKIWSVKPKLIYVIRNPKDVAISFYHLFRHMHNYTGSKNDFLNAYCNGQILYGSINDHAIEFWKISNKPNILFLFFEDRKRNLEMEVKKVMKFLDKNYSQEQIDRLCQHLSFESMSKNSACNFRDLLKFIKENNITDDDIKNEDYNFVRKGKIGSHKEELTDEENAKLDEMLKDPQLENFNFSYKF